MPNRQRLSRPARILIASDQDHALRELEGFLGEHGYAVLRVYAGAPVLKQARIARPDVIVLDARLADRQSLNLSRELRDDAQIGGSTPILLLVTGHATPQDHLAALRAGIWELLPPPLSSNELLSKLDTYVVARVEADRAPRQNVLDGATGLYTAQGLVRRARELIFQASQHNTAAACVVFAAELEGEAQAEGPGSRALADLPQRVAHVFQANGRRSDAIGRVGPSEFAVVAPGTDAAGAVKLAERLRRSVGTGGAAAAGAGPPFELRAGYDAVGNVRYTPVEPNDLLARAARAMQLAKAEGKWIRASGERG
jgi:diguanylate cyclase (GGDEF)-like protein